MKRKLFFWTLVLLLVLVIPILASSYQLQCDAVSSDSVNYSWFSVDKKTGLIRKIGEGQSYSLQIPLDDPLGVYMCEAYAYNEDEKSLVSREVISLDQSKTYIPYGVLDANTTRLGIYVGRNEIPYAQRFSYNDRFAYDVVVSCLYGDCGIYDSSILYALSTLSPTLSYQGGFVFTNAQGQSQLRLNLKTLFNTTLESDIFTDRTEVQEFRTEQYQIQGDGEVVRMRDISCVVRPDLTIVLRNGTRIHSSSNYVYTNDQVDRILVNASISVFDSLRFEPSLPITTQNIIVSSDLTDCGSLPNCLLPGNGIISITLNDPDDLAMCDFASSRLETEVEVIFESICPDSLYLTNATLDWTRSSTSMMHVIAQKNGYTYEANPLNLSLAIDVSESGILHSQGSTGIRVSNNQFASQPPRATVTASSQICPGLTGSGYIDFVENRCTYYIQDPIIRSYFWRNDVFGRVQVYEYCPGYTEPRLVDISRITLQYSSGDANITFLQPGSDQTCRGDLASSPTACYRVTNYGSSDYLVFVDGTFVSPVTIRALCPYVALYVDDYRYSGFPLDEYNTFVGNSFTVENISLHCRPDVASCRYSVQYLDTQNLSGSGLSYSKIGPRLSATVGLCQKYEFTTETRFTYDGRVEAFCQAPLSTSKEATLPREHRRNTLCSYYEPDMTLQYLRNHVDYVLREQGHSVSDFDDFVSSIQLILENPSFASEFRDETFSTRRTYEFIAGGYSAQYLSFGEFKQIRMSAGLNHSQMLSQIPPNVRAKIDSFCGSDSACNDVIASTLVDPGFYIKQLAGGDDPSVVYCYVDENPLDTACCSTKNSCVYDEQCYAEGQIMNIDSDGLYEICEPERTITTVMSP